MDINKKVSNALKGRKHPEGEKDKYNSWKNIPKEERRCRFTKEQILKGNETTRRLTQERINNTEFHLLSKYTKKKIVSKEQYYRCLHCNLNEWLGKQIVLELDHIDGNKKNEYRDNLRCLCPNCHSQTHTWKGRNIKKNKKK